MAAPAASIFPPRRQIAQAWLGRSAALWLRMPAFIRLSRFLQHISGLVTLNAAVLGSAGVRERPPLPSVSVGPRCLRQPGKLLSREVAKMRRRAHIDRRRFPLSDVRASSSLTYFEQLTKARKALISIKIKNICGQLFQCNPRPHFVTTHFFYSHSSCPS